MVAYYAITATYIRPTSLPDTDLPRHHAQTWADRKHKPPWSCRATRACPFYSCCAPSQSPTLFGATTKPHKPSHGTFRHKQPSTPTYDWATPQAFSLPIAWTLASQTAFRPDSPTRAEYPHFLWRLGPLQGASPQRLPPQLYHDAKQKCPTRDAYRSKPTSAPPSTASPYPCSQLHASSIPSSQNYRLLTLAC